jgi:hypothetical protein
MGFVTNLEAASATYGAKNTARARFAEIAAMVPRAMAELPLHRDLIGQIAQSGQWPAGQRAAR